MTPSASEEKAWQFRPPRKVAVLSHLPTARVFVPCPSRKGEGAGGEGEREEAHEVGNWAGPASQPGEMVCIKQGFLISQS